MTNTLLVALQILGFDTNCTHTQFWADGRRQEDYLITQRVKACHALPNGHCIYVDTPSPWGTFIKYWGPYPSYPETPPFVGPITPCAAPAHEVPPPPPQPSVPPPSQPICVTNLNSTSVFADGSSVLCYHITCDGVFRIQCVTNPVAPGTIVPFPKRKASSVTGFPPKLMMLEDTNPPPFAVSVEAQPITDEHPAQLKFTCPSIAGWAYVLQCSSRLGSGQWQNVPPDENGDGQLMDFYDPMPDHPLVYRIMAKPGIADDP